MSVKQILNTVVCSHQFNVKKNLLTRMPATLPFKLAVLGMGLSAALLTGCQTTHQLKTNPKAAVATRTALAAEYIRSGDLDAAKRNLDEALETDSKSVEANNMMGVLLQQEGSASNLLKAETYFKRAVALDPTDAQVRNNYGVYLSGRKRYPEAVAQFKVAAATLGYDGRAAALENLGRTYVQVNDRVNAEKTFKQALQANRDSLIARLELAEIFLQKNQLRDASGIYNDYLRITGGQQGARSLWLGIRIARAERDNMRMNNFVSQLSTQYPNSTEYKQYLQLQQNPEAVWK